jgi:hypothetical protein
MSSARSLVQAPRRAVEGARFTLVARALGRWRSRPRYPEQRTSSGPSSPTEALESALANSAFELAAQLAEPLCARLDALAPNRRGRACVAVLDTFVMLGQRERAHVLAARHRAELAAFSQGVGRLECLGIACPLQLGDGTWNLLGASLRTHEGTLAADDLVHLVGRRPWAHLSTPELGLLCFSALWPSEPQLAIEFLRRFLLCQGLSTGIGLAEAPAVASTLDALARLRGRPGRHRQGGPLVSVVVPAYGAAATLGYALDSLLAQTHTALEILVADDASQDETLEVMKRYADDPRVRLFRSSENQGAYNVRNQLVARARGQLVAFHDADDWALPERIAEQVAALRRTRAQAVVTGLLRVTARGQIAFFKNQRATRLSRVSLLLRREAFGFLGGFRSARVGADLELAAKLSATWGPRALVRLRAPYMLSRLAEGSAIATPGTEASVDGYRAPVRRAYGQLVFDRYQGGGTLADAAIDERLRELGNWQAPAELMPV